MAETARSHDTGRSTRWSGRPPLEVVKGDLALPPSAATATADDGPDVGRAAMVGAAVGFAVVTVAITIAGTLGGIGFGASLGLGVFVGVFSGGGFGFMMGATMPLARHLATGRPTRSTHHAEGDPHDVAAR